MTLQRLSIQHCRNLSDLSLELAADLTVITGPNGSGKTTILEAIHLLCVGKSFRVHTTAPIIQYEQPACTLFGEFSNDTRVGLRKTRQGKTELRINQETQPSLAAFASQQPVQVIDNQSFDLIDGPPEQRRRFLDWGLFHVEPTFYPLWRKYRRVLAQRNKLLKAQASPGAIAPWDTQLAQFGGEINQLRRAYLARFMPVFEQCWQTWLPELPVLFNYYPGWPEEISLETHLENTQLSDRQRAFTQFGPHRADIKLLSHNTAIKDVFSRGQKKLLVTALLLAQGLDVYETAKKSCIYLIDDIAAELDPNRRAQVLRALNNIKAQTLITSTETIKTKPEIGHIIVL